MRNDRVTEYEKYTNKRKLTGATGQPLFYIFFKLFILSGLNYFGENKAGGCAEEIAFVPSLLVGEVTS